MEGADESLTLLAAGAHFSAAVSSRGHLYVWGEPVLAADTRARSAHDIFLPQTSAEEEHSHLPRMARASAGSTTLAASGSSTASLQWVLTRRMRARLTKLGGVLLPDGMLDVLLRV